MLVTLRVKVGPELLDGGPESSKPPPLPLFDDRPERKLAFLMESSGVIEDIQEELDVKPL